MPLCLKYLYSQAHQREYASSSHPSEPPASRTDEQVFWQGHVLPQIHSFPLIVFSSTYILFYPHPIISQMLTEGLLYARHFGHPF